MTDHPIRAICVDETPSPVFARHFQLWQRTALPLGDPELLLVMASDGTMLVCRYMPTGELLDQIRTQRLPVLLAQLRQRNSDWIYLLLDGELTPNTSGKTVHNQNVTGFDWKAIQGCLTTIQEAGISIVWLQSSVQLQDQIYLLAKRSREETRVRPPRDLLFVTVLEDVLLSFQGIGEERCAILTKYGNNNLARILESLTNLDITIPGIPKSIQIGVRKALGLKDETWLAVTPTDAFQLITYGT